MAITVARLEAILRADTRHFDRAMSDSERRMQRAGKAAGLLGAAIATGLAVTAKIGWDEMREGQKVTAQTNAVLRSTAGIANVTAKHVDALAQSILRKSGIDDEAIASGENMLLTFKNIRNEAGKGNDIFDQSTKILTDMTVALRGGDVSSESLRKTAIQLGKALNDPTVGMTALRRVGVTFSDDQVKLIKRLYETGHVMEAQKLILRELNSEFGGSAEALGKTLPGQINIAREQFRNLSAQLIVGLVPALTALTSAAVKVTTWLQEHPKLAKVLAIALGVLATALIAASVAQRIMNAAAMANPYVLIAAAIIALAYVVYKHWPQIEKAILDVLNVVQERTRGFVSFFTDSVPNAFRRVLDWVRSNWPAIATIISGPFAPLVALATNAFGIRSALVDAFNRIKHFVSGVVDDIVGFWRDLPGRIASVFSNAWNKASELFGAVTGLFGKIIGWIKDFLGIKSPSTVFYDIGKNMIQGVINGVGDMAGALKNKVIDIVKGLPGAVWGFASRNANGPRGGGNLVELGHMLQRSGFQVGENPAFGGVSGGHVPGSYHYRGRAIDVNWPGGGGVELARLRWAYNFIRRNYRTAELMIEDVGKANQHLHVAMARGGIVTRPTMALIGERGPEAVIPLERGGRQAVGGDTYNFNFPNYVGSRQELMAAIRQAAAQFGRQNARPAFGGG